MRASRYLRSGPIVHERTIRSLRSWDGTIREQRRQIARELKQSPSLKPFLPEALADVYPDAVERAVYETGLPEYLFPQDCPYSIERLLEKTFYPGES